MTPTDEKPMTVDALEAIAREVGQVERRHCIGKAQGFDVRDAYYELRAAIVQYGREQYARGVNDAWPAGRGSGEPVAFVNRDELDNLLDDGTETIAGVRDGWRKTPLYAAPQPPREPLTDEQIDSAIAEHVDPIATYGRLVAFARAIERAHNIRSAG